MKKILYTKDLFLDNYEVVPLETTKESLLKNMDRIILLKNRIIILDKDTKSVLIFDRKGHFINKIKNLGKGPGEYIQIRDCCLNDDDSTILVHSDIPYKLLAYTLDGKFKYEHPTKTWYINIASTSGNIVLYNFLPEKKYKFCLYDKKTYQESYLREFSKDEMDPKLRMGHLNLNSSKSLYFNEDYNDTIYKITDSTVTPAYYINFGKSKMPEYLYKQGSPGEIMDKIMNSNGKYYTSAHAFREYKNYIIFKFSPGYLVLYSKKDGHTEIIDYLEDKKNGLIIDYFAHDGNDEVFLSKINSSVFCSLNKHISLFRKIHPEIDKVLARIGKITETDNPVLFLYRFKE